jgi:glucan 1,3-beta-glucosidase
VTTLQANRSIGYHFTDVQVVAMRLLRLIARSLLALSLIGAGTLASPSPRQNSDWWFASIERTGRVPFGNGNPDYPVFRNVKDYGARGDGVSDDTAAINAAISAGGGRCGQGCDSSTTTPALVYFPPGTYVVSTPLIQQYYTHMIGDLLDVPTLKAAPNFVGIAVIDANPRDNSGNNWFTNQNNFFRQIRNFKIDVTAQPMSTGTGIHWQVAQATSLQNIEFFMIQDSSEGNRQQGLFIENGSGGFMTDLIFHGGNYGAFFGSQQFTARNLEFNNCKTAIFQVWNWIWNFHGLKVNNCGIGIDMSINDGVGSVIVQDSVFTNTRVGVSTTYSPGQQGTNGTLVIDNCDFSANSPIAVQNPATGATILAGNKVVASFVQGRAYTGTNGNAVQAERPAPSKPAALLDGSGKFFTRSKPQYGDVPVSKIISVKTHGAVGDGAADDTAAIQAAFNAAAPDEVVFFPHGAYLIHNTVNVPANIRIVGEMWPLLMAAGTSNFQDQLNPKPMLRVGQPGDVGTVEISDFMIETKGPQPGAILMEWNVDGSSKGSTGLWDVHFRVGGSAGTDLQSDRCSKTPEVDTSVNPQCIGAWMLMHVTQSASIYMENTWLWVSDHELDRPDFNQINIYNGRGILFESTKAAWLWGTASEHSVLYNYQFQNARNVYMTVIQTETAYYQGNPAATVPFQTQPEWNDPDWSSCTNDRCAKTWGLRVRDSSDILFYGGGMYSFFENYTQQCLDTEDCQENMVEISNSDIVMYAVNTKASVNAITLAGGGRITHLPDNESVFCAAIAAFTPT